MPDVVARPEWKVREERYGTRIIYERALVDGEEISAGDVLAVERKYVDPAIEASVCVFEVEAIVEFDGVDAGERWLIRPDGGGYYHFEDLVDIPEWVPAGLRHGHGAPADAVRYIDGAVDVR